MNNKQLFTVEAIKDRRIKGADGKYFKAPDGYVVYRTTIPAGSEEAASEIVEAYYITPGTKYDRICAYMA